MESSAPQTLKKAMRLLAREGQPCSVKSVKGDYELVIDGHIVRYDRWGQLVHDTV